MTADDLVLRFHYPSQSQSQHANDMRTVNIKQVAVSEEHETEADLYKVRDSAAAPPSSLPLKFGRCSSTTPSSKACARA